MSTPSSPSGKSDSLRGPATARDARESVTGGVSDVDKAMALAVAAAHQMEGEGGARGAVKGPTGAPQPSLARPKVGVCVLCFIAYSCFLFCFCYVFFCLCSLTRKSDHDFGARRWIVPDRLHRVFRVS